MSANQIRRMFTRLRSNGAIVASATAMALAVCTPSTNASLFGGDVVPATSEHDPALTAGLVKLSPSVSPDEARRVAFTAYTTGRQLAVEWRMVRPATVQSFLIHIGARKAGHCYQYANELLLRLDALKLRTLELHWAECAPGEFDEHTSSRSPPEGSLSSRALCWITGGTPDVWSGGRSRRPPFPVGGKPSGTLPPIATSPSLFANHTAPRT